MTNPEPGQALTRLREALGDGFGYDPATHDAREAAIVTALALACIAESLHALAAR